jgi:hypothetical protein
MPYAMRHAIVVFILLSTPVHQSIAQGLPPIHKLRGTITTSHATFGTIAGVRELPDGRVLVNDVERRKLTLLNAALTASLTLADDSAGGPAKAYGAHSAALVSYRGDSTLLIVPEELSMIVISPHGTMGRAMAVPNPGHVKSLVSRLAGTPGFDNMGRLVYRAMPPVQRPLRVNGSWTLGKEAPDSAPIIRANLATRNADTVAYTRIAPPRLALQELTSGRISASTLHDPLPVWDEWVVTADGSIAIVRSSDYHVDWVTANGKLTASPRIPFDWHRLSDEEKAAMIQNLVHMMASAVASANAAAHGGPPSHIGNVVRASDLPDYVPPFRQGSVRADENDRIWVRTSASYPGATGLVYDVINRQGKLVDRVELPPGRSLIGFGRSGAVFLVSPTANLERLSS